GFPQRSSPTLRVRKSAQGTAWGSGRQYPLEPTEAWAGRCYRAWTRASEWDRVEITNVPQGGRPRGGLGKWRGRASLPLQGGLGRNYIQFIISRRLVTTYAPDSSPIHHPLRGRAVACLQRLYASVPPDRGRSAAGAGSRCFR